MVEHVFAHTPDRLQELLHQRGQDPGYSIHANFNEACSISGDYAATIITSDAYPVVTASGRMRIVAQGGKVTAWRGVDVRAGHTATVEVWDDTRVFAAGNARVLVCGAARVEAAMHATVFMEFAVEAQVRLRGAATAHVTCAPRGVIHAHQDATVYTFPDAPQRMVCLHDRARRLDIPLHGNTDEWLDYHGIAEHAGHVVLYKGVDHEYTTPNARDRGIFYTPRATPNDLFHWRRDGQCGNGLHFCATPGETLIYAPWAARIMACPVNPRDISVIDMMKVKAPKVVDPGCFEVDLDGKPIGVSES